ILINSTSQDAFDYTLAFCQPDDSTETCGTGQNVPSVVIPNSLGLELTQSLPTLTIDVAVSDYGYMSGTSMATPHATAAVALIKAKYPAYSTEDIRQVLGSTAVDLRDPGKDKYTGWGLIDIAAALSVEVQPSAPVADFNYSLNGLELSLNNLSSDADNDITAYAWDLGDGNTSTASDPVHTYGVEGVYNIVLQTTDATGLSDNKSLSVTVEEPGIAPVADFSYSVSDLTLSVAGNATDADGTVVSYAWDFGDGNSASGQNASHSYANSGDYTVTLTATDDEGLTDTLSQTVTVTAPPVAPVADFSHVVDGLTVTLNDLSTDANNDIVSYEWDLGDGNSASEQSTVHTYAGYGSYSINLTVTDSEGLSSQKSATLELSEPQGPIQLSNGVEVTGLSGVAGSELLYVLNVDDGAFLPSIKLYDGTGNADLYVAQGRIPTTTDYDEKATTGDSTETIRLWGNDVGGDWYILIKGAASYSGVTLRGKYRSF
ncbi:MAG: PKD domain-containing protein, partial [Psychrosphaera sp.]|nr:PKD domain-containing protein [Psychrosphaera sp.]